MIAPDQREPRPARAGTLRHDSVPMRLYHEAKRLGAWDPRSLDLRRDVDDWARFTVAERDVLLRLTVLFQAAEESMTRDLLPLVMAVVREERLEEQLFLTTFLADEAKHTEFFRRVLDEVCRQSGDLQRYQTPSFRRLFAEQLPVAMRRLLVDPSPTAQAEALVQRAQQSILNTDNRCGRGVDGDDDLYGGGEGGRDGGRSPLSAKLAAYGECLTLERRLRGTEEEKVVDAASEVGVGEINPAVFTVLGEGVIVREFAMRGCWICLGRRTLRGRGFITRGGLIPATVVRFSYRIAYINPIIYSLTTQIPFPIPTKQYSLPIVPIHFRSQPSCAIQGRHHHHMTPQAHYLPQSAPISLT